MRKHLLFVILSILGISLLAQSPHGVDFDMNCAACHTPEGWEIPFENWNFEEPKKPRVSPSTGWVISSDTLKFNHHNTNFPLEGEHTNTNCIECHGSLVFSEADIECISCHQDIHRQTVGSDCARCHTMDNWMVDNITELHQENGFPLLGIHASISCDDCHISESNLEFNRIGNECVSCHLDDFMATTNPNHLGAGFSTDCAECHTIDGFDWSTEDDINHDFFPLTKGHAIDDCVACHVDDDDFANTPTDCFACHQLDFQNSENPNHQAADFSTNCVDCHTTDVGWEPAEFADHDALFPIYSGAHQGAWMECVDCHNNSSNYAEFTCINCHLNPETDEQHVTVSGYTYEDNACLACHPTGDVANSFDHNDTNFPLTGAHIDVDCIDCHTDGYEGTPTDCASCHTLDYTNTTNPDHNVLNLSTDCASCHTTDPGWSPATFDIHDDFHPLNGAHAAVANDCAACHNGDYNNTPNTCVGCHQADFDQTTEPDHVSAQFPVDCESCHSESAWTPSSFNHDEFYPLTGAHQPIENDCIACHNGDYENTPNTCIGCHTQDFEQSVNPNHVVLNLSTDCESCHTTQPDWMPATFDIHYDFYPLNGAHAEIANDCVACHNGDYNNTPNTCFGCHAQDFNETIDPNHVTLQFSTDCISCHTETAWEPSTFDHDGMYFPIYSGTHQGEWDACTDCHLNPSNYAEFTCITCHTNPETDDEHVGVNGYSYADPACLACHPTGSADDSFDHNQTNFPLTGAHIGVDCLECHANGFEGTPMECAACHTADFNQTTNPNHNALGLSTDCASCHTTDPGWSPASFDVHDDFHPLNGAHAAIANECATCHNGDYNNTPNTCVGCHQADFDQTTEPDHVSAQFPVDCESCHSESAWTPSSFNHDEFYPLTGAHQSIANDCIVCHDGDYENTPNTCAGCHTQDFEQSVNPNHVVLNLSTDCESCHTTQPDWMPATFDIHNDFYPLNGAHAAIANDCVACHNGDYNNTPNTCFGCHAQDFNETIDPNHVALQFSTDCISCHTETAWEPSTFDHDGMYFPIYSGTHQGEWDACTDCHLNPSNYAEFTCITCHTNPETDNEHNGVNGYSYNSPACLACHPTGDSDNSFDHSQTAFPLTGAHIGVDCLECHANGFQGTSIDCSSCHIAEFNQTTNPNHNALGLSTDCATCHTTEPGWLDAAFPNHDDFHPLNGAHAAIANECATCHNGDYNNTPNTCAGCHTEDYNQATNPDHVAAQFPIDCESCHSESAWTPSSFDHNQFYPLTGAHQMIENDCAACHNGNYENTPNTCAGCHTQDFEQTVNPNHVALNLSTECESCHTTQPDWMPATFDVHNDFYPLNGAHAAIANDCVACHNGDYNNTPNTCFGCHAQDFNETTDPNHALLQFSTDCISCHTETAWEPSTFDHDGMYFPIYSGTHQGEWDACTDCHTNPSNYAEFTCITCHTNPETDNEHNGVNGYSYNSPACLACHPTGDSDNSFDHNQTAFPLTGAHIGIDCLDCHANGFEGTSTDCASCHIADFNQTTNPNHNALGISTDCATCHTTEPGWVDASFPNHDDFHPLNGAHAAISNDCAACHNGDYNNTPNTCAGCHAEDYTQTTNPDHEMAQFPMDCESCHTETAWIPSFFDHNQFYPLTGVHQVIENDCFACHNGDYSNTPNTCVGCHQEDFNQSINPNHNALGLSTDCESCHTTQPDWIPATFDIHNDFYPLNGAHAAIANDCVSCHNGDYNNTPNTCFGCHAQDFNETTDPNHALLQFSTDCIGCHTETAWEPSTFDHDGMYFPIYSGTHQGEWDACTDCHTNPSNYAEFTCITCHTNPETDNEHNGVNGYSYNSPACLACHPTGDSDNSFDHNQTAFPLTGAHIGIDCLDCHANGFEGTSTDCASCHIADFNQTTNPNHNALGISTDCATCHTTEPGWVDASFPNHNDFHPLNGAHAAIANDCAVCHNGDYNNTPNTCAGCHTEDYNQTTNPNHAAAQFPMECESCHSESAWIPATFDHDQFYPLTGAHQMIENDCAACHNGDYNNTPNTCAGCHTEDFNQTLNPNHISLGLSTDCESCHTTQPDWMPATFAIHDQFYPLNGAHAAIANDCVSCHNGDYNNTPNTCFGCHQSDFNNATNPNHLSAGFPTDCTMCHTETAWEPSTFDHDAMYFPIYSGKHQGEWDQCVECHTTPGNFSAFSCIDCHEHNDPAELADDHEDVNDYEYSSPACYACHPNGEE